MQSWKKFDILHFFWPSTNEFTISSPLKMESWNFHRLFKISIHIDDLHFCNHSWKNDSTELEKVLISKSKSTLSESVSEWQGHLSSCSGQLKTDTIKIETEKFWNQNVTVCLDSHSISYNYTSFTYTPNIQTQVSTFSYKWKDDSLIILFPSWLTSVILKQES